MATFLDYSVLENAEPFFLLAGPCVIESHDHAMRMASELKKISEELNVPLIYKSSFDKANRTSIGNFRGPGIAEGLTILEDVKKKFNLPIVTDVHDIEQCNQAGKVVDILQIPAFLFRQTDLLIAAGKTGRIINVKKGQWADGDQMKFASDKIRSTGNGQVLVCDRGVCHGYHDLILDPRNLVKMRSSNGLVVQDCTHSVQQMGAQGGSSGGLREFIPTIARTAVAVGVAGLFFEVHDNPDKAFSDSASQWPLIKFKPLCEELVQIAKATKGKTTNYLE